MSSSPHRDLNAAPPHAPATDFVPARLDATKWANIEALYTALLQRPVKTAADLEQWLLDRSELDAACSESRANLYINMTCHTDDEKIQAAWSAYLDEVPPKLKPVSFELDKKQAAYFESIPMDPRRYEVLKRNSALAVELFRPENIALETKLSKLNTEYEKLCGEMTVTFRGQDKTLPQMGKFLQEPDRPTRRDAWKTIWDRRLKDREAISDIYDKQITLRHQIALNAGFSNYRDYQHRASRRFDYTPEDCFAFHEAIEKHCVPFMRKLDERRKKALAVDALRPWDLAVDEKSRAPLQPFEGGQQLIERSRAVFDKLDPQLAGFFKRLGDDGNPADCFDLESRKGKAFGGYQYMRDRSRIPFIFMNAAGLHRDVKTMVHEAGHAFHSFLCADEPLLELRDYPTEFAEVASMSMELLSMPYWDAYYPDKSDADRARREQLESSLGLLPWVATIDAFQHWIYLNPNHSRAERTAQWLALMDRFGHAVSWEDLDEERAYNWQGQGHLFGHAFYYIEYGIAQLGSLGIWLHALERGPAEAIKLYKRAMKLGGSRPLPELFAAADLPFDFGPDIVGRLVEAVERELAKLPE